MATKNPRITITLTDKTYALLKAISGCTSQPMSTFVTEMLETASPTLERMAVTFQKIKQAQEIERSRFMETLDDAQAAIEPVVMQTLGQFDLFLGKIERAADVPASVPTRKRGPEGGAAAAPASSPPTNRGDTPTRRSASKPSNGKASKAVSKKEVLKKSSVCTCTITKHERQENRSCPVHFPKGLKNAV